MATPVVVETQEVPAPPRVAEVHAADADVAARVAVADGPEVNVDRPPLVFQLP